MAKLRLVHRCTECGGSFPKWSGKCLACGAWNSLVEDVEGPEESFVTLAAGLALVPPGEATPIGDVNPNESDPVPTGIGELDRVLGGGLVPGSVTLLGGEPGIGKSTLLLQVPLAHRCMSLQKKVRNKYVCAPTALGPSAQSCGCFPKCHYPTSSLLSTRSLHR